MSVERKKNSDSPLFSILIPSLKSREKTMHNLIGHLLSQEGVDDVEILVYVDEGEITIGQKRNELLLEAKGKFSAFVDDDDWVSDLYVTRIVGAIKQNDARSPYHIRDSVERTLDCIGFMATVSFAGEYAGLMMCSTRCGDWTEEPGLYLRPPCHLNPLPTERIKLMRFRELDSSEDHFWCMGIRALSLIRKEYEVFLGPEPMYHYRCGASKKGL